MFKKNSITQGDSLELLKKIHNEQYKIDNKRFEEEKKFNNFFDYVLAFSEQEKEVLLSEYGYKTSQIIESTPGYKDDVFYSIPKVKARNYFDLYQKGLIEKDEYDSLRKRELDL